MPSLLDLPAELRNAIYTEVLVYHKPIEFRRERPYQPEIRTQDWDASIALHGPEHHALTQVSRQLRSETLPILYGANTFFFANRMAK